MTKETRDIQVKKETPPANTLQQNQDMSGMLERFFDPFSLLMSDLPRRNVAQVRETENAFLISAEIPGVPKEDIEIDIDGDLLSVRAERSEERDRGDSFFRQYRSYRQTFALPSNVDTEKIQAQVENGMLEIELPKMETEKRKIEVRSSTASGATNRQEQQKGHHQPENRRTAS